MANKVLYVVNAKIEISIFRTDGYLPKLLSPFTLSQYLPRTSICFTETLRWCTSVVGTLFDWWGYCGYSGAGADICSVLVPHLIGEPKYIMGCVQSIAFIANENKPMQSST